MGAQVGSCPAPFGSWNPSATKSSPTARNRHLARPFKLLSVALTPFPNIPGVKALANQAQAVHGQAQAVPEPTLPPPPEPTLKAESNPQNKAKTNEIMKSKLLGCDPQNVSQARAAAVFRAEVMRLVMNEKMTLDAAWAQVKATEPDLAARMSERRPVRRWPIARPRPRHWPKKPLRQWPSSCRWTWMIAC